jgi:hypothetical protein
MDNQVKIPKSERGGFLPESENSTLNDAELGGNTPENVEGKKEEIELEPLVATFETRPELLDKADSDDKTKKKNDDEKDKDENGVIDEDDELIVETFKGSKADEGGTSGRVEDLIRKTDRAILKKEKNPYKFMNYWRRMKQVAMEEWFNRKIGEGLGGSNKKEKSIESTIGENQSAAESLAILQNKQEQNINGGQFASGKDMR